MPDAPVTQDTINAGPAGDDSEGEGDIDEADSLPKPEDAPVTTETITIGRPPEDDDASRQDNNDNKPANTGAEVTNKPNCPTGQQRTLFDATCKPIHHEQANDCGNGLLPLNVGCQNTGSQIQGDENGVAASGGAAAAAACGGGAAAAAAAAACGEAAAAAACESGAAAAAASGRGSSYD